MAHDDLLCSRVGAFFTNTYGIGTEEICDVCRGPASSGRDLCSRCAAHRVTLGGLTCDHTVIFTYAQGHLPEKHQSAHTVRPYKAPQPAPKCVEDMKLTVRVGTEIHGRCIFDHIGHQWDSVTYVPSSHGRTGKHPVGPLAASVAQVSDSAYGIKRFLLDVSDSDETRSSVQAREPSKRRFIVPGGYRTAVQGRHVLLVDDTWVTGASIQSAAAVLKLAGAASVTALCVARWLSTHYEDQARLMQTLGRRYEPFLCPIDGLADPAPATAGGW